ncbi:MAG: hypothetical protein CFE31_17505 [Rhizobiales bacterium PAR1]|nr:MAG: hypothetical protein CFE31_17505 [Rhizobiales bacterium PAR1]
MRLFLPDRISAQLTLLIVGAVLLANIVVTSLFFFFHEGFSLNPAETTGRLAALIETLDGTPTDQRSYLIERFRQSHPEFKIADTDIRPASKLDIKGFVPLARALGSGFLVSFQKNADPADGRAFIIQLRDGTHIGAVEPLPPPRPIVGPQLFPWIFAGVSLLAIFLWSGSKITHPLQRITRAAEHFRPEVHPEALPEQGPYEIRALASAFNVMQGRISELLVEKTNALAAVSHDLRTPITRMRLRAEFLTERPERDRMIHDLDIMDQLTRSALDHLRSVADGKDRERVDLASLLHSLVDRLDDEGQAVSVEILARPVVKIRGLDLERALDNLVENAFRYATPPILRLSEKDGVALIEVEDHGPGIPADLRDTLVQPFSRGDSARTMDHRAGFGLGLTIARQAILRQGGTFQLLDARPHGLLIQIKIPTD